ncbi:MAG TPA: energy transducer TonB [Terriglobia bacterium]|nr:energy transducer TonB [Terriglobia bacterium]
MAPVRVGGQVQAAKLIFHPQLEYPAIAKEAGVEGLVRLRAVINKDGTIKDLKIINGHRLLAGAAVDGVRHWRYQPTLLDGAPIEVETEIDVDFKLPH